MNHWRLTRPSAILHWRYLAMLVGLLSLFFPFWYSNSHSSQPMQAGTAFRFDFELPSSPVGGQATQPEDYLRQIQTLLDGSEYAQALERAEALTSAFPNFQLGAWLYADLLSLSTGMDHADPMAELDAKDKPQLLHGLQKELRHRLRAMRAHHPAHTIPKGLGYLAPSTEYLAVVDASASRMYVFRNTASADHPVALDLLYHTYVSVGQNGIHKRQEGDGRTPVGVYFTQKSLADKRLPDLYGAGALTLNYPNLYDVHQGRTGSGIWIHGTPSAQYSRAPEASDGCLVLSNDTMGRLMSLGNTRGIPLFIQEKIDWVPASQAYQLPKGLRQLVADKYPWTQTRSSAAGSPDRSRDELPGITHLMSWHDQDRTVVLLDLGLPKGMLRSYWVEQGGHWTLAGESPM